MFAYSEDDALQDLLYLDVHGAYMVLLQEGYTMQKVTVAFNNALRMILGAPRYCSASEMFAHTYTPSCPTVRRKMIYSFRDRLEGAKNCITGIYIRK